MSFIGQNSKNSELMISRSGFWPELDGQKFRVAMRILDSVKNEQVEMALLSALDLVISELRVFRAKHAEYLTLEAVPCDELAGKSRYVFNFERAVFSEGKAKLLEDFRDMDLTRKSGEDRANLIMTEVDELRRDRWNAVRTFYDEPDVFAVLV